MKSLIAIAVLVASAVGRPQPATGRTAPLLAERDPAPDAPSSRTRVNVHPFQIRVIEDTDYNLWSIEEAASVSTTINDLDLTLSAGSTTLNGGWYKYGYTGIVSNLGERVIAAGISTNEDSGGGPITLSITGLAEGTHSLLTWHNAWDGLDSTATLSVAVDGTEKASVQLFPVLAETPADLIFRMLSKLSASTMSGRLAPHTSHSLSPLLARLLKSPTRRAVRTTASTSTLSRSTARQ